MITSSSPLLALSVMAVASLSAFSATGRADDIAPGDTSIKIEPREELNETTTVSSKPKMGPRFFTFVDLANTGKTTTSIESFPIDWRNGYNTGYGIGADYIYRKARSFGGSAGFLYEFERKNKNIEANSIAFEEPLKDDYPISPKLSLFLPSLNANFSPFEWAYLYGGFNYSVPSYSSEYDELTGKLGYQTGIGATPFERVFVEALYQRVNYGYRLKDSDLRFGGYQMDGFQFRLMVAI